MNCPTLPFEPKKRVLYLVTYTINNKIFHILFIYLLYTLDSNVFLRLFLHLFCVLRLFLPTWMDSHGVFLPYCRYPSLYNRRLINVNLLRKLYSTVYIYLVGVCVYVGGGRGRACTPVCDCLRILSLQCKDALSPVQFSILP